MTAEVEPWLKLASYGLAPNLLGDTKPSSSSRQRNRDRCGVVHHLAEVLNLPTEAVIGGKPDGPDVPAKL